MIYSGYKNKSINKNINKVIKKSMNVNYLA